MRPDRRGVELLCAHPEIFEEVLRPEILRRRRNTRDFGEELRRAAGSPRFTDWLWLYVRAEQMRHAIGEFLGDLAPEETEGAMTQLADAVLPHLTRDAGLLVVALGKYGGEELAFGSDLDLFVVVEPGAEPSRAATKNCARLLHPDGGPLGPVFSVDMRLRPHGDAGPLVTTLPVLSAYHGLASSHAGREGGAQTVGKAASRESPGGRRPAAA